MREKSVVVVGYGVDSVTLSEFHILKNAQNITLDVMEENFSLVMATTHATSIKGIATGINGA